MKAFAFLVCFSCVVLAQSMVRISAVLDTVTVEVHPSTIFQGPPVTGAPYSAEQVSEQVQALADGIHINQPQNDNFKMSRDSAGRTRTERLQEKIVFVEIADVVGGARYFLDDQNKIAHKFAMAVFSDRPAGKMIPTPSSIAEATKSREEDQFTKLGSRTIDGVTVEGTRWDHTFPIGQVGNDRPMVATSESWYSPELKLTMLSKSFDPRSGEYTTKIVNMSRAEPDPSLFMPPAGYAVVDEKDAVTMTIHK